MDQTSFIEQQSHASTVVLVPQQVPKPEKNVSVNHCSSSHPVHKTLATAANLANLLPTGTVLAFRTLTPSFTNKGCCRTSNEFLAATLIGFCSIACFFSSFTDSFMDCEGKLCYGIATFKGFHVFNKSSGSGDADDEEEESRRQDEMKELSRFRIRFVDFVHAFVGLFVFLIYALSDSDVSNCFFPGAGGNLHVLVMNLPLGAGFLASFLFVIFPTTRRGIGYGDLPSSVKFCLK